MSYGRYAHQAHFILGWWLKWANRKITKIAFIETDRRWDSLRQEVVSHRAKHAFTHPKYSLSAYHPYSKGRSPVPRAKSAVNGVTRSDESRISGAALRRIGK
jgi:hypothetical protein